MSLVGQILDTVEAKVRELLHRVTERDDAQDARLDDLEARVAALETGTGTTAARKATAAKAATAGAKATATSTK